MSRQCRFNFNARQSALAPSIRYDQERDLVAPTRVSPCLSRPPDRAASAHGHVQRGGEANAWDECCNRSGVLRHILEPSRSCAPTSAALSGTLDIRAARLTQWTACVSPGGPQFPPSYPWPPPRCRACSVRFCPKLPVALQRPGCGAGRAGGQQRAGPARRRRRHGDGSDRRCGGHGDAGLGAARVRARRHGRAIPCLCDGSASIVEVGIRGSRLQSFQQSALVMPPFQRERPFFGGSALSCPPPTGRISPEVNAPSPEGDGAFTADEKVDCIWHASFRTPFLVEGRQVESGLCRVAVGNLP